MGLIEDTTEFSSYDPAAYLSAGVIFLCPGSRTVIYHLNRC